ncbi:GNAT family N-acetyltransferase [Acetobacter sp. AN02]|uniref:GNAT family N-acetyltransferase n=1 Tax=Acetobacter sp. AN02 TaxID=2894186 RepID=UPI0024343170|nr:GNAT family N-acetyltransferase [Acetobacter sp. AN02]MDG6093871.1 GNAT family N-acetyltransferase [Acetobacter sp. AN02]
MASLSGSLFWRPMSAEDLPAVSRLAGLIHADYPEDDAVFAERLHLCPAGCFLLEGADGAACGYLFSHPWRTDGRCKEVVPALNTLIGALPECPDFWYLHDIALISGARGTGMARAGIMLVQAAAVHARVGRIVLTSTAAAVEFWRAQGFERCRSGQGNLGSYGAGAVLFERAV